jgi:hypothetical protein
MATEQIKHWVRIRDSWVRIIAPAAPGSQINLADQPCGLRSYSFLYEINSMAVVLLSRQDTAAAAVTGLVGAFYLAFPPLEWLLLLCSIAYGLWGVLAGARLFRLGAPQARPVAAAP